MSAVISDNIQEPLYNSSHRCQHEIDTQAVEIGTIKTELTKGLEENLKLKEMFDPDLLVNVLSKTVSN